MSGISSLSSHIEEEALVLRALSDSIMKIQAAALGDLELLGISAEEVEIARNELLDFIKELQSALTSTIKNPALQVLISSIDNGPVPKQDWIDDIQELYDSLETGKNVTESVLQPIENILAIISDDYAEGVRALYHNW